MKRLDEALKTVPKSDDMTRQELKTRQMCTANCAEELEIQFEEDLLSQEAYHESMKLAFKRDLTGYVVADFVAIGVVVVVVVVRTAVDHTIFVE